MNAALILNRRRFLAKYGLDDINSVNFDSAHTPLKSQLIGFLQAVQYLKVPLIGLNAITVIFEMILGGT